MYAWVYAHGCHLTIAHYERLAEHISTLKASVPTGNHKANIGFARLYATIRLK